MRKLTSLAVIVLFLARVAEAETSAAIRPEYSKSLDIPLLSAAVGLVVIGAATDPDLQIVPVEGLDPAEIHFDIDADALGKLDLGAGTTSDVLVSLLVLSPFILSSLSAPEGSRGRAPLDRVLLFAEAIGISDGVMLIAQNAVSRPRPYAYSSDADRPEEAHYDVARERTFQSMPSGHSTSAWCAASFTMTDHLLTRPNASWKEQAAVGFTAGLLASSTSLLRVEAGQHFPTDVMMGAAIGMAGGVLVPMSHRYFSSEGRAPLPSGQSWLASFLGAAIATGIVISVDAL